MSRKRIIKDFVDKIKDLELQEGECFIYMYPPKDAVEVVRQYLANDITLCERTMSKHNLFHVQQHFLQTAVWLCNGLPGQSNRGESLYGDL